MGKTFKRAAVGMALALCLSRCSANRQTGYAAVNRERAGDIPKTWSPKVDDPCVIKKALAPEKIGMRLTRL